MSANLPRQVVAFIRKVAPFGYCDACLAEQLLVSVEAVTGALTSLALPRRRRLCYGCRRTSQVAEVGEAHGARGAGVSNTGR